MLLAHKIQLNPNNKQIGFFNKSAGVSRFAYNWALEQWKIQYEKGLKPSEMALRRDLNAIKKNDYPWILEVPKSIPQQAIKNLGIAYKNAFDRMKKDRKTGSKKNPFGFPIFKKKFINDSFRVDNGPQIKGADAVKVDGKKVKIPILGWVRLSEKIRFDGQIKSLTITRIADKWFASFQIETDKLIQERKNTGECGIDLGIKTLATLDNGKEYKNAKALKVLLKQKQRLNRSLSKKKIGSKNMQKTKKKLARFEYHISCIRNDNMHKATTDIATNFDFIGIENLKCKNMVKNHNLALALSDSALGEFRRQLEYKAKLYGGYVQAIDTFYPSSKTCSSCSNVKKTLKLSERTYKCEKCGVEINRDHNAAKNILRQALSDVKSVERVALAKIIDFSETTLCEAERSRYEYIS